MICKSTAGNRISYLKANAPATHKYRGTYYGESMLEQDALAVTLARWPLHSAFAKDMDVKMLYSLLSVFTCIDHASVSVPEAFLRAYLFDLEHHMRHKLRVLVRQFIE